MNALLWILQVLAALLFGSSGTMKVFFFDEISADYPTFEALPREVWTALGVLEIVCTIGLLVPSFLRWKPKLTVLAAGLLALETIVFIAVHLQYGEIGPMILSGVLGLTMAFVAYGRGELRPIC
ncbi:MAG: DoxX family protein [Planctomycetes bacterium]|nr:DoxX family protein [Planctomycetota bacterium]